MSDDDPETAPNEKPLDLPFGDWKDALGEFLERETEDEPKPEKEPGAGGESGER